MKPLFLSFVLLFGIFTLYAQSKDSVKINFDCRYLGPEAWNKNDTVYFETQGNSLLVTMVNSFSATRNGPIWAVRSLHMDTIIVRIVDYSTQFYLDICTEYTVFRLPVDPIQKTILLKLNDKLYKIPHLVTGVELISEEMNPLEMEEGIVYLRGEKVDKGEVSLFSMDGKRLLYFEYLPESVSLKNLPTGAYILHLTRGHKSYRKSLYKQ